MNRVSLNPGVKMVKVPDDRAGQRLDNFLLGQLKGAPRSLIYKIIRDGQVRINGKRAKPDSRLEVEDEVRSAVEEDERKKFRQKQIEEEERAVVRAKIEAEERAKRAQDGKQN